MATTRFERPRRRGRPATSSQRVTARGSAVRREVRALTDFAVVNLVDASSVSVVAPVDVVFCRNVLIYFHHDAKRNLADLFFRKLRPGGYLLLGHAESLLNVSTDFEVVSLRNDLVYRRPEREWANR